MLLSMAAFSQYSVKYDTVRFKRGGNIYRCRIVEDTLFLNSDTIYLAAKTPYTIIDGDTVYVTDEDVWLRDTLNKRVFLKYSADSVGIGTAIPTTKLDVRGDAKITTQVYLPGIDSSSTETKIVAIGAGGELFSMDKWKFTGNGGGDTTWIITRDTVWYDCDTIHLDTVTYCYSDPDDPSDLFCIFYDERDSLYNCSYYIDIDTTYIINNYGFSPWLRDSILENVYLKHVDDRVAIGTSAPTVKLDVNGDTRIRQGIYIHGGLGDVNGDGQILPNDVTMIRRYLRLSGTTPDSYTDAQKAAMDVTGDGMVSRADEQAMKCMISTSGSVYNYTYPDSLKRLQGTVLHRLVSGATVIGNRYDLLGNIHGVSDKFDVEMNGTTRMTKNDALYFGGIQTNDMSSGVDTSTVALYKSRNNLLTVDGSLRIAGNDTLFANNELYVIGMGSTSSSTVLLTRLATGQIIEIPMTSVVDSAYDSVYVSYRTNFTNGVSGWVRNDTLFVDTTVTRIYGGGINTVTGTYPNLTVTGTEVDGSISNELDSIYANYAGIQTGRIDEWVSNDTIVIDTSFARVYGAGINVVSGSYPNYTVTATEVDGSIVNELDSVYADYMGKKTNAVDGWVRNGTLYIDTSFARVYGGGINVVTGTYPNYTVTATEADGSVSNELQSFSFSGTSYPTVTLSHTASDITFTGSGATELSLSNDTINIYTPIADSLLLQGLNTVMGIDSSTDHQYISYYSGNSPSIALFNWIGTPTMSYNHVGESALTTNQGLMTLTSGGSTGYWDGTYIKKYNIIKKSNDSIKNILINYDKAIISAKASEDWSTTANGTYLAFFTTGNTTTITTEKMRITNDGKIGIGTKTPTAQLTVAENVHLNAPGRSVAFDSVYVKDLSTGDLKTTHKSSMGLLDSDSTAWIHNSTRGVTYLRNDGDSVGIGTKIPDRLLEVDGTAKVKDSIWIGENYWLTTDEGGIITNENFQSKTLSVIQNGGSREIAMFGNDVISNDSVSVFTAKSNLVLGGNEEKNYRLYINGDEKVINKIYAPGITTAASEDSIIAWKASTGEFIAVPKSVFPTDTSAFVHTPSGITHLRNINDVVSIGTTSTNDINRKLHAEGSASIRDTVYIGGVSYIAPYSDDVALITNGDFRIDGLMKSKRMNVSELTNDGTPDSVVTVKNGNFYASALSSVNLYRYSAYSSGSTKVEVLASGTGITAAFSAPTQLDFTIPSGVRIVSAKINITGISTLTIDMGTTDMVNSSLLDRWMPIVQVWREDTGAEQTGVTTTLITSTHDQFRINGLNNAAGMHIRLSF